MDVALDSNILIADPWLRSQNTRALIDYIKKTPSRVLICELVEKEVKEHFKRKFNKQVASLVSTHNKATRNGVLGIPKFFANESIVKTLTSWDKNYQNFLYKGDALSVPISNKIFQEAINRSTERIPPCSESGEGIRDTTIWLSLLEYCSKRSINRSFAFISKNTRDFAELDKSTLKKKLIEDSNDYSVGVYYYPSLNEFLKQHAEPIAHVTTDWVASQIDYKEVEILIRSYLGSSNGNTILSTSDGLQIEDDICHGKYLPIEDPEVLSLEIELFDCFVWRFDDEHIETGLEFFVHFEAEGLCIRSPQLSFLDSYESQIQEIQTKTTKKLKLYTDLWFHISAEIVGSEIKLLTVEDKGII